MSGKILLWDFDNTLAYSDMTWSQIMHRVLCENGMSHITMMQTAALCGTGFPWHAHELSHKAFFGTISWWDYMERHFATLLESINIEHIQAQHIAAQIRDGYLNPAQWHLFDDTLSCLQWSIETGFEMHIASNHVPELHALVKGLGIEHYFGYIFSSALVGWEKSNRYFFQHVLDVLGYPTDVTMIGDNYRADVLGALDAGIEAIFVRSENYNQYPRYCKSLNGLARLLI